MRVVPSAGPHPIDLVRGLVLAASLLVFAAIGACDDPGSPSLPLAPTAPAALRLKAVPVGAIIVQQGAPLATFNGVKITHGGYGSALAVDPRDPTTFFSLSDRGPNVNVRCGAVSGLGFGVPSFTPEIGKFRLAGTTMTLVSTIALKRADGTPITGLPHPNAQANRTEIPFTLDCAPLTQDPLGIDSEGLAFEKDGTFWVSDEYGPDVVHFTADGRTIEKRIPGSGLPLVLARRRSNRGMEGLTIMPNGKTLVGLMQSPLDNPTAGGTSAGRSSRLIRLVVIDTRSGATRQYPVLLDAANLLFSDVAALTPTTFLVIERDGNFPLAGGAGAIKKIYKVDIENATDISDPADGPGGLLIDGKTLEELTKGAVDPRATLLASGIIAATKTLTVDLLQAIPGYPHDKVEGLAVIDNFTIAISNDDDFGVGDDGAGKFSVKALPLLGGVQDYNSVYILRLTSPLKD
ncbi:MAG: esterase-like activity of phytase family protein [Gemmatimonadaceae bacterium]